jgi:hypothetical protein
MAVVVGWLTGESAHQRIDFRNAAGSDTEEADLTVDRPCYFASERTWSEEMLTRNSTKARNKRVKTVAKLYPSINPDSSHP